jgi:hypothetical protein
MPSARPRDLSGISPGPISRAHASAGPTAEEPSARASGPPASPRADPIGRYRAETPPSQRLLCIDFISTVPRPSPGPLPPRPSRGCEPRLGLLILSPFSSPPGNYSSARLFIRLIERGRLFTRTIFHLLFIARRVATAIGCR